MHNSCRSKLAKKTGISGEGMDAHHIFPQAFKEQFQALEIDINDTKFLTWIESNYHRHFSYAYNMAWQKFFDSGATYDGAFEMVKALASDFFFLLNFK